MSVSISFKCPSCGKNARFKGKKSELSRGENLNCTRCGNSFSISKKHNGRLALSSGNGSKS